MKGEEYVIQNDNESTRNDEMIEMHDMKIVTDTPQPEKHIEI